MRKEDWGPFTAAIQNGGPLFEAWGLGERMLASDAGVSDPDAATNAGDYRCRRRGRGGLGRTRRLWRREWGCPWLRMTPRVRVRLSSAGTASSV